MKNMRELKGIKIRKKGEIHPTFDNSPRINPGDSQVMRPLFISDRGIGP